MESRLQKAEAGSADMAMAGWFLSQRSAGVVRNVCSGVRCAVLPWLGRAALHGRGIHPCFFIIELPHNHLLPLLPAFIILPGNPVLL